MKYIAALLLILSSITAFARGSKHVSVTVTIAKTDSNANLIIYGGRQLTLGDFQGAVDNSVSYTAVTFSAIDIKCTYEESEDSLKANVIIKPYFDKTKSWCKFSGRNDHTLAHEQLHFDLTGLKACELIKKLQCTRFTKDSFAKELHDINQQLLDEVGQEQDEYDNVTHHGIIVDKQAAESTRIKALLQKAWCYN